MADADGPTPEERDQQLEREAVQRPRAAIAAAAAAVLLLGGGIEQQSVFGKAFPTVGLLQALRPALQGMAQSVVNGQVVDPRAAQVAFYDHHAGGVLSVAVVIGIGTAAIALALTVLFDATRFRRPQTPVAVRAFAFGAPIVVGVAGIVTWIIRTTNAHNFVHGHDFSRHAVDQATTSSTALIGVSLIALIGGIAIGIAFVIISLNAMRVGLLPRFMGILGIIVGVLFALPLLGSLMLVQAVWLGALAMLLYGRWPGGNPPAWEQGEAVPWPSQQQLREQREARRGGGGDKPDRRATRRAEREQREDEPDADASEQPHEDASPTPVASASTPAPQAPHSSSKKRRRKRRR